MNTKLLAVSLLGATILLTAGPARAGDANEVIVTNPNLLPPPGTTFGWVDHPCSHEVYYLANWTVNGKTYNNLVVARAHSVILSNFGTPTMVTDGADVVTTFAATLTTTTTVALGTNVSLKLSLPGTMSVRLVGKALATTGTFLMKIESMSLTDAEFGINVRQDPSNESWGSATITDLGNGTYSMVSGLDAHTQISLPTSKSPLTYLPYVPDLNAPAHFEFTNSTCPNSAIPVASFQWLPALPLSGQAVNFSQTTAGTITSSSWDFGDGTTGTDKNPTHTFTAPGMYPVRLTVQASSGSDSLGTLVNIGSGTPSRALARGVSLSTPARVSRR